jgi:hypothetical protein
VWRRVACALACSVLCLGFSWGQAEPAGGSSYSLSLDTTLSATTSQELLSIADKLSQVSTQLSDESTAWEADLQSLKSLVEQSRTAVISSAALVDSADQKLQKSRSDTVLWKKVGIGGAAFGIIGLIFGLIAVSK